MRLLVAASLVVLVVAALLVWPRARPSEKSKISESIEKHAVSAGAPRALPAPPPPANAAEAATDQLRYVRLLGGAVAVIDDPKAGQTWSVRSGDRLLGMTVVSVDPSAVRLSNPTRVLAFAGPPPPPVTQRPFPNRPDEIPVVYAPGVVANPERDRELLRAAEMRQRRPGEARMKRQNPVSAPR